MVQSISELERWDGGFPADHEHSTLENLERSPELDVFFDAATQLLDRWKGNQFVGLYLYGTPGTGKTHAAVGLGRAVHDKLGAEVNYRYVPEFISSDKSNGAQVNHWTNPRETYSGRARGMSIFPSSWKVERNPRTALILDDYRPDKQLHTAAAVEAAAQYGGLVIITSNYTDPFKLLETARPDAMSEVQILYRDLAQRANPDGVAELDTQRKQKLQEFSTSFQSRIAAGFRFIEFTGPDRRAENGFWA